MTFPDFCLLRRGLPADLARYAAISRDTFRETFRDSHTADAMERHLASAYPDAQLREELAGGDHMVLAVEREGEWIGYALLSRGAAPACIRGAAPVQIARFYVASAWHGRGIAAPLMQAVIDEARRQQGDVAWLGVWEHNSRALRFYSRQGFVHVGRTVYPFDGVPEQDLLLQLPL